jgi:hypothetical protein
MDLAFRTGVACRRARVAVPVLVRGARRGSGLLAQVHLAETAFPEQPAGFWLHEAPPAIVLEPVVVAAEVGEVGLGGRPAVGVLAGVVHSGAAGGDTVGSVQVVHLLHGDAVAFSSAYLSTRLGLPPATPEDAGSGSHRSTVAD